MWPFSRLSPRTRRLLAAFAIAARLLFSSETALAESPAAKAGWAEVEKAKERYAKNKNPENEKILVAALQRLINLLKKDAEKMPPEKREKAEEQIERLEKILATFSATEIESREIHPKALVAINSESQKMLSEDYEIKGPLTVTINKETIILLTDKELKKIYEQIGKIKNLQTRKNVAQLRMKTALSKKPKVLEQLQEAEQE